MIDKSRQETRLVPMTGELSYTTVPAINKHIYKWFKQDQDITLDLSQVTSIDNIGVGLLVSLTAYAQRIGKRLVFMNMPKQVEVMLDAVKVRDILPIVD